ncbi:hypothetical protein [Catellatospora tritici]|uniref:hypothetical protein n=1 Tax=Catellatospora tritici TaxID=2851566 RepID=UPI0020C58531|nr:hypothetical protein [Catellatospora tritici]
MREIPYCFVCWPGGPVTPPPCYKCGSTLAYWSSGLCSRCHPGAPGAKSSVWRGGGVFTENQVVIDSCVDCQAWGVTRTTRWLCWGCKSWRESHPHVALCPGCGREVAVHSADGICRLCHKQRGILARFTGRRVDDFTVDDVARIGQQLFFADMWHGSGGKAAYRKRTAPADMRLLKPVSWQQLTIGDVPRDLRLGMTRGFPPPPDDARVAAFNQLVNDHAARHGWHSGKSERIKRAIRILQGTQDTPGARFKRSDIALLSRIKHSAQVVADVLAEADLLDEDRQPAVVRWFHVTVEELPEPMRAELQVWFDVMRNGSTDTPRQKPRSDTTISTKLRWAMPALRHWAAAHDSLREVGRENVLEVIPPQPGTARSTLLQGLRSIFTVLKGRKLVFVNPTIRIKVTGPIAAPPPPVDLQRLRDNLNSTDPTKAALSALLAFHAVRIRQLRHLLLTDLCDGRLHIGDHVILLAEPVRQRLAAYLDYRQQNWPTSTNPHLFIHQRSWSHQRPVWPAWINQQLGMSGQVIRRDRILDEVHATSGDIRALTDLFGLTAAGAMPHVISFNRAANDDVNRS